MKQRILLIDDDKELCEELRDIFMEEGYFVQLAHDGPGGKKLIEDDSYDLIIIDIKLPGLGGLDLLKISKNKEPKTKVFVISGRPFITDMLKDEITKNLVDGVIGKPFMVEDVVNNIKSVLQR
ncbi:MAG: response regulator [Candidatus Omnitrophota bacterium]|nr:response regulator [Candidatus Omnitrophota bacterium]